jgi:methylamine dehydrogenase accessory protein MauD
MSYWEISNIILWVIVILILIYLIALTRQIGILHMRVSPTGARMTSEGLKVGEYAPFQVLTTIKGTPVHLSHKNELGTILLFISVDCPGCVGLVDSLQSIIYDLPEQIVLVFSTAGTQEVEKFIDIYELHNLPVVISSEVANAFQIEGVPYGFAIDSTGIIRGKGITNTVEHTESLANTIKYGIPSMEHLISIKQKNEQI